MNWESKLIGNMQCREVNEDEHGDVNHKEHHDDYIVDLDVFFYLLLRQFVYIW